MISNWRHFHSPFEPMKNFTRHEPFGEESKATFIDGRRRARKGQKKMTARDAAAALRKRMGKKR